jgi:cyclic pyranopterin phosphate synthase
MARARKTKAPRRKRPATRRQAGKAARARSTPAPRNRKKRSVRRSPPAVAPLSHLDARGQARMVDVTAKGVTERQAIAEGRVIMTVQTLERVLEGNALKGDVLGAARLAGIMAAKRTHGLIPLCHPLPISKVSIDIDPEHALPGFLVRATVNVTAQTGVEMEALTAVSIACLTIYDMVKAIEKGMRIEGIRLLEKTGGKSGTWKAEA